MPIGRVWAAAKLKKQFAQLPRCLLRIRLLEMGPKLSLARKAHLWKRGMSSVVHLRIPGPVRKRRLKFNLRAIGIRAPFVLSQSITPHPTEGATRYVRIAHAAVGAVGVPPKQYSRVHRYSEWSMGVEMRTGPRGRIA